MFWRSWESTFFLSCEPFVWRRQEESEQDREERRQKEGSIKSKIKWSRDIWQRTLWKIKERGTKRGQQRGVERKRGESGSSCMPENAWQESRDTGLRHLSVGVALYAGLCSGFILLYAPAFLSLLGKLWRRPRGLLVICSGRLRRPRQALGSIKPRINWHKAPCSKHKHMFMAKMVWRSWESTSFLVAVVIVGFVWVVCFDATDTSKTSKVVWALYHFISFFMSLPYTASL